jgi:hypothetical protein
MFSQLKDNIISVLFSLFCFLCFGQLHYSNFDIKLQVNGYINPVEIQPDPGQYYQLQTFCRNLQALIIS